MNTTFSVRVDENTKKSFLTATKTKGLDGSVLIRYFMEQFSKNPNIVKFEIDDQIMDNIFNIPKPIWFSDFYKLNLAYIS